MDTFSRESVSDLFVAGEEEVSIVVLKYGDNLLATWQRNKGNSLSFEGMVDLLSSEARVCFFQKSSEDHKGKSQHKIIIPIGEEKAIEIIGSFYSFHVGRFTELFAYSICQAKEIRFLKEPIEDTKQSVCQIILSSFSDKIGTNDITFRELYTEVDSLNIPLSEINKEKDKEIWQKYVEALKKIVKQKEQVWKIREIGSPYVEKKDSNDRLIDIHVENQDKHFEMELKELFEDELKYCSVKNDLAFIEFKTYRKLDQESSDQLNDLAIIYCYDIVKNSPKHRIDGEIRFKYTDSQSRGEILSQVKTVLAHDYGILITINKDGSTDILEKDFPHIQKVIEDTFKDILELQRDNHIQLKVTFKEEKITIDQKRDFKTAIDIPKEVNFDISNSIVTITTENAQIYNAHVDKIKHLFPNVILESRPYRPTFFLRCKTDLEPYRQSIIGKIRNDIGQSIDKVEYKVLERHTKLRLSYQFCTESEREEFKQLVTTVCTKYEHLVEYPIENNEGTTTYELKKNEQAEREKEKEINDNLRRSMFIYLTPEEYEILNDPEREGNDITTEKGEKIGALCSKKGDRLKFRIRDSFDDLLNGKENERLDINEIRKGYIKPIFPGELVNIDRMIRAMEKVTNPGGKSEHFFSKKRYPYTIGYPANYNLPQFLFDPRMAREPSEEEIKNEQNRIKKNLNEPLLEHQPKQLEAVSKSVITKDMALIQGPPGTGKTTVIAEIMWQILSQNPDSKILLTSQTHLAVDNALERLKGKKIVRPIRIGNTEKFEDEGKAYSKDRIEKWCNAIPRSEIEKQHSDNAIHAWINNIATQCEDNPKYQKAINQWKKGLMEKELSIKKKFSEVYINYANVFAATCSECGSKKFGDIFNATFLKEQPRQETSKEPEFDVVIMDEASKATPPELVLPLTLGKKVIIIGDHKQLPPMIDEKEFGEALEAVGAKELIEDWKKDDYKKSQFEKLFIHAPKNLTASLDTQFRMHGQIMNCISQFYKDQKELKNGLICGIQKEMDIQDFSVKGSRWHGFNLLPFITPEDHAIWVNVETPEKKVGTSYENEGEVEAIQTVLRALTKAEGFEEYLHFFNKETTKEIGIITYYMPQMQRIRDILYPTIKKTAWRDFEQHKYENEFQLPFRINTVDRFQGMEREIVIISTVRSNRRIDLKGKEVPNENYPYALGFAREPQRVNVGFSRARRLLIVVGNEQHFSKKSEYKQSIKKMYQVDIKQL